MAIREIPAWPSRQQDQAVFDANMAKVMTDLPLAFGDANAMFAAMGMMAAGGGFALAYTFSTTTTDADPGNNTLRLDNATQNLATRIRLDVLSGGVDVAGAIATMDDSTSTIKGSIRLVKVGDPTAWLMFNLTAIAFPSGYRNLTVEPVDSSAASPFANGETVVLQFTPKGDKGDTGATGIYPAAKFSDRKASGTGGGVAVAADITQTRTLNTTEHNTIAGASLSSNQVTLPAGTYEVSARAPAHKAGQHQLFLYNVTDAAYPLLGSTAHTASAEDVQSESSVAGRITIAATKVFALRHFTQVSSGTAYGLGVAIVNTGQSQVYTEVTFTKVA